MLTTPKTKLFSLAMNVDPPPWGFSYISDAKFDAKLHSESQRAQRFVLKELAVALKTEGKAPCISVLDLHEARLTRAENGNVRATVMLRGVAREKFQAKAKEHKFVNEEVKALPERKAPGKPMIYGKYGPVPCSPLFTEQDMNKFWRSQIPGSDLTFRFLKCDAGVRYKGADFQTTRQEDLAALANAPNMPATFGRIFVETTHFPVKICSNCFQVNNHGRKKCTSPRLCPRCRGRHELSDCNVHSHWCLVCHTPEHDTNRCPHTRSVRRPFFVPALPRAHFPSMSAAMGRPAFPPPAAHPSFAAAVSSSAAAPLSAQLDALSKRLDSSERQLEKVLNLLTLLVTAVVASSPQLAALPGVAEAVLEVKELGDRKAKVAAEAKAKSEADAKVAADKAAADAKAVSEKAEAAALAVVQA
jgi:hypothetical protein